MVVQVTVPVGMPGHAVTSISILSLHKSDMRLLHLAAKLGPLIAEAAQDVAVAMTEEQAEYDDQQQASTTGVLLIMWCQPALMERSVQSCVLLAIVKLECQLKQSPPGHLCAGSVAVILLVYSAAFSLHSRHKEQHM